MSRTPPRWGPGQSLKNGWAWTALRQQVIQRDQHTCQVCGAWCPDARDLEVDHVVSREAGGPDTADNLRALCRPCHRARTNAERGARTYRPPTKPQTGVVPWADIEAEENADAERRARRTKP